LFIFVWVCYSGFNTGALMVKELRETAYRHNKSPQLLAGLVEVIMGPASKDNMSLRRSLAQDRPLSVAEQMDCLIEHATDPNIIGRVFQGWGPWC
jgi:DNA-dependent protein kinase catalytic subunit